MSQLNHKPPKDQKSRPSSYARFSGLAIQMFAIIGVGTFIGYKLDERFPNTYSTYTIIFSLGSVIMSIVYVIRRIIAESKDDK
jgi:F0F1-type ATP synthase assembly protein I